jgi:hypothetical protein
MYENGRWIELALNRAQWRALVVAALNHHVLLPELIFMEYNHTCKPMI